MDEDKVRCVIALERIKDKLNWLYDPNANVETAKLMLVDKLDKIFEYLIKEGHYPFKLSEKEEKSFNKIAAEFNKYNNHNEIDVEMIITDKDAE